MVLNKMQCFVIDTRDRFQSYRTDCADTLQYCHSIMEDQSLRCVLHDLSRLFSSPTPNLLTVEAHLFAIQALAEYWIPEWSFDLEGALVVLLPWMAQTSTSWDRLLLTFLKCLKELATPLTKLEYQKGIGLFEQALGFVFCVLEDKFAQEKQIAKKRTSSQRMALMALQCLMEAGRAELAMPSLSMRWNWIPARLLNLEAHVPV